MADDPTPNEQLLLEYINDARLDPVGNAARYITSYSPLVSSNPDIQSALTFFGVDGAALQAAFTALVPAQPLAWNENLATASRAHNAVMIANDHQSHQEPGEPDFVARDTAAGYMGYSLLAENVFAFADSDIQAQAAFMVDWGGGPGGMQSPPGHRNSLMNSGVREIGIGITPEASNATSVGPLVVTEDMGARFNSGPIILGVAYNDTDHNNFYSMGEGLGSLTVAVGGGSSIVSSASGGYSLVTSAGVKTVTLSGAGLAGNVTAVVTLGASSNVKLDVIDGTILHTSASVIVTGPAATIVGLGLTGLTLEGDGNISRSIIGTSGADTLIGGAVTDTLSGSGGNDMLFGHGGNDTIDGGSGTDTAIFSGLRSAYVVSGTGNALTVTGPDGADSITNVELLQFADTTIPSQDTIAPTLSSTNPGDDAANISADANIVLIFNEAVKAGTGNFVIHNSSDNSAVATIAITDASQVSFSGSMTTINPAIHLAAGTSYYLTLASGVITDLAGNPYAGISSATAFNFTTALTTHPASDFNGDGKADILWRNDSGEVALWQSNPNSNAFAFQDVNSAPLQWTIQGHGDFNGDGKADILWRDNAGNVALWQSTPNSEAFAYRDVNSAPLKWAIQDAGDFNGDGKADILWRDDVGNVALWQSNANSDAFVFRDVNSAPLKWIIQDAADFNGDGKADILWRDDTGEVALWQSNPNSDMLAYHDVNSAPLKWTIQDTADFNGDGKADILWRDDAGEVALWQSNPNSDAFAYHDVNSAPLKWTIQGAADFNGDGKADILWRDDAGNVALWQTNSNSDAFAYHDVNTASLDWHIIL